MVGWNVYPKKMVAQLFSKISDFICSLHYTYKYKHLDLMIGWMTMRDLGEQRVLVDIIISV
jgi:hypothetical protein